MSRTASLGGGQWGFRGPRVHDTREGFVAFSAVVALHAAVGGVLLLADLSPPVTPPESILEVSFIAASAPAGAPAPPQAAAPPPPPPEPTVLATPGPTQSPMAAPPVEETPRPVAAQPAAAAPAPPSPAPSASSPPAAAASAPGPAAPAVTPPSFTAAYLNNPGPAYPIASRRRREEGTVRLRVQVSAEGAPAQVLLDRSSGFKDLDAAALDIVKKRWRFAPARQGGAPVAAWVIVPLEFSLKDR